MYIQDTIAAISTPLGEGGVGIVRISGAEGPGILHKLLRRKRDGGWESHRFCYGDVIDPVTSLVIDDSLAVWMKSPRSYTGEDVVEIHCHGGLFVVQKVLDLVLAQGARLAAPGEFTRRAYLNGRIDLVQAQAVIDVIRSKTDMSLSLAQRQKEGKLSEILADIRQRLVHALALIEAFVDFPEEEIDLSSGADIRRLVEESLSEVNRLVDTFNEGKVVREGVAVVIAGKPNVGKSSLLNALLCEKRAIVTSIPGTTRDIIEEVITIDGLPVKLLDTAGIHASSDEVEKIGIDLALEKIPEADLILLVLDGSRPFDENDQHILDCIEGNRYIIVINKSDLPLQLVLPDHLKSVDAVPVSTASGAGLDGLRQTIRDAFLHGHARDLREYVALSHSRQRYVLERGRVALARFVTNLDSGHDLELLAVDLRDALHAVGEVTGETTTDDVLDIIFSQFCIGK